MTGRVRGRSVAAIIGVLTLALVAGACAGGSSAQTNPRPAPTTTAPPTTTTTVFVPTAPLTGLPDPNGVTQTRAALSVKIDNTPEARPQSGLDVADVVYEEVVEGNITRFWAIFHAGEPAVVGPIRSVRFMDPNIVWPLGGVVAFSGGTNANVALIREAPITRVDESNAGDAFFRESTRAAPHNLYGDSAKLWGRGGAPVPPRPLFTFLAKGETFLGEGIDQFRVGFASGYDPTYTWDPATRTWKRAYGPFPFMDTSGHEVAPANVIVQFVHYPAGAEGELIGEGEAWVFSDNKLLRARWVKPNAESPTQYLNAFGVPIALTPGRTWVELLRRGSAVDLVASPPQPPTTIPPPLPPTTAKKRSDR